MTGRGDPTKAASRILRERAMAILRDTRAKIDPALLSAMKERLAPMAGGMAAVTDDAKPATTLKQGLFKRDYKPVPQPEPEPAAVAEDVADENGMVPVDREKIAQIVLQYMKNREDSQKH